MSDRELGESHLGVETARVLLAFVLNQASYAG